MPTAKRNASSWKERVGFEWTIENFLRNSKRYPTKELIDVCALDENEQKSYNMKYWNKHFAVKANSLTVHWGGSRNLLFRFSEIYYGSYGPPDEDLGYLLLNSELGEFTTDIKKMYAS